MTKRNGVYFYEMWVGKGKQVKTIEKPDEATQRDGDGDIDMNKKIMQVDFRFNSPGLSSNENQILCFLIF